MNLWIDEFGCVGLTDFRGNIYTYILPQDTIELEVNMKRIIRNASIKFGEEYNEATRHLKERERTI